MRKLLFIALLLLAAGTAFSQTVPPAKKDLSLEAIWGGGYLERQSLQAHLFHVTDSVAFIRSDKASNLEVIVTLDFETGRIIDTIFSNQVKTEKDSLPLTFTFFEDFGFSPDDSKILVRTQIEPLFANGTREFDFIWDRARRTLKPLTAEGKQSYVQFSPDSKRVSFIRDGNLYVKDLGTDQVIPLTMDGASGKTLYGMADALYQNGFGMQQAYEWSPGGNSIAFLRFNESVVQQYPITYYDGRSYPEVSGQRYPNAGEAIPEVTVFIYNLTNKSLTKADLGVNPNQYITGIRWQPDGNGLWVQRLNRPQTKLDLFRVNPRNGNGQALFSEESKEYVRIFPDNLVFLKTKNSFLWLSETSGYTHIYEVPLNNFQRKQLTSGNWEVLNFSGVDEENGDIYFMANAASPRAVNLYKVGMDGKNLRMVSNGEGVHQVLITEDFKYFLDEYSRMNQPSVYQMFTSSGKPLREKLIVNKLLLQHLEEFNLPVMEAFSFSAGGPTLDGWLVKPAGNPTGKLPLLIYIYGGNSNQQVRDEWMDKMGLTMRYLASQGFLVACIDPSGTPGRGREFRNSVNKKMGDAEIGELIALKKYLAQGYRADSLNTAIMGWSFGGYLSALAATKFAGHFKAAISIAPVTNWRFYDNVYTERLLQLPAENPEGYKNASPVNFVQNYSGGLLLIHGSADDNVHFQNSMEFSRELINANKQFQQYFFPDYAHTISSSGTANIARINLFTKIRDFLHERLQPPPVPVTPVQPTRKPR